MTVHEIADALAAELRKKFATVRISAVQAPEQFLTELKAINPDKLPGVIIVFDGSSANSADAVDEFRFTLVAVDRFRSSSDARALGVLKAAAELMTLFPSEGRYLGAVFMHSTDCSAATPDPEYSALALGVVCKQGFSG
ncbi:MAG: hypothetical protein J6Y54_09030 [Lentisphaeria bacterium]|nr:hypothetical protein [Lentisphaeria bacterium]